MEIEIKCCFLCRPGIYPSILVALHIIFKQMQCFNHKYFEQIRNVFSKCCACLLVYNIENYLVLEPLLHTHAKKVSFKILF